ncbi:hypothetical protein B4107_2566 [Bacillus safensis]|nr:hypothetical protein B4107_2566 [Bacillus safensis]
MGAVGSFLRFIAKINKTYMKTHNERNRITFCYIRERTKALV